MMSELISKVTKIDGDRIESELIAELVRCKNCVHYYNKDDKGRDFPDSCDLRDWFVSPDWFCGDGRKKDD